MPHEIGPQIPEYQSTDADVNRPSKAQSQRRTKAACLQNTLKLMPRKARNKEERQFSRKKIVQRSNVPNLFNHSQGRELK